MFCMSYCGHSCFFALVSNTAVFIVGINTASIYRCCWLLPLMFILTIFKSGHMMSFLLVLILGSLNVTEPQFASQMQWSPSLIESSSCYTAGYSFRPLRVLRTHATEPRLKDMVTLKLSSRLRFDHLTSIGQPGFNSMYFLTRTNNGRAKLKQGLGLSQLCEERPRFSIPFLITLLFSLSPPSWSTLLTTCYHSHLRRPLTERSRFSFSRCASRSCLKSSARFACSSCCFWH